MSREIKQKTINDAIKNVGDGTITNIYKMISELCDEKTDNKKCTRAQKIKFIKDNLYNISDDDLPKINEIIKSEKKYDEMYATLLEILNEILEHIGKNAIDYITEFKCISRTDIATNDCMQIVLNNSDKIVAAGFVKNVGKYNGYKKDVKHEHIPIIKKMCLKLGYKFSSRRVSKQIDLQRVHITEYFIEKK